MVFLIPCSGTKEERDDLSSGVEEASRGYGTKGQQGMISKLYKSDTTTQVSEFIAMWFTMMFKLCQGVAFSDSSQRSSGAWWSFCRLVDASRICTQLWGSLGSR